MFGEGARHAAQKQIFHRGVGGKLGPLGVVEQLKAPRSIHRIGLEGERTSPPYQAPKVELAEMACPCPNVDWKAMGALKKLTHFKV